MKIHCIFSRAEKFWFALSASLFILTSATAQQHITLNQSNTTGVYTASGSIRLLPGFSSSGNFHAYITPLANCLPLAASLSQNRNYIVTYTPQQPFTDASTLPAKNTCEVMQQVQYFDGLGRMLQTVQVKGSPQVTKDLVTPFEYDNLGRVKQSYLPYASATADGSYKTSGLTEVVSYYQGSHAGVVQTSYPYSVPVYEPSPANRIIEQGFPGSPWQPYSGALSGSGHTQKMAYQVNTAADTVKLWLLSGNSASTSASYAAGQLTKTVSKDENWSSGNAGTVEEYKDMEDRVVCKRVWETASVARSTYYVYDEYNRLRYVIPPKVTVSSFNESTTEFGQLIYGYHYDGLGRLIEKKIPGKGWEEMVYNKLHQLVMSRDAVRAAANQWLFSKYDTLGRTVMTGIISSGNSRLTWQASFNAVSKNSESRNNSNSSGTGTGYTNVTLPAHSLVQYYHTLNYYDDYAFYNNSFGNPVSPQSSAVKSLLTGSRVNVLGSGTMLLTTNYYDAKGQLIQSKSQNHLSGTDVTDLAYNFTGQLTSSTRNHTVSGVTTMVYLTYEYDHMGRKTKTYQKTGNSGSVQVLLSELEYNEVGQLTNKRLNNGARTNAYRYNERGWLTGSTAPGFSMQLKYTDGTTPQWNGNIANQLWSTDGGATKTYTYSYDKLNRLTAGVSTDNKNEQGISYDPMGNILSLTRDINAAQVYSYSGNRLNSVTGGVSRSYSYDANGNALTDGINTIGYNILNLPSVITGANAVTYTFDATGRKLSRVTPSATTQYVNGIQYAGSTIDFIQTEEGLARRNTATEYLYQYNLTDHLGNSRYTFNGSGSKLQSDDYYPFGLTFNSFVSGNRNPYLYVVKELQGGLGQYDYGARFYDPMIGKFNTLDPLGELSRKMSPYSYALNNPIRFIDVDGMYVGESGSYKRGDRDFDDVLAYYGFKDNKGSPNRNDDQDDDGKRPDKKQNDRGSDFSNWGLKAKTTIGMFTQWLTGGLGMMNYVQYNDDEIADAMRNSDGISKAREFFYNKYAGTKSLKGAKVTNYSSSFGVKQLFKAGFDPIEQFVGSFKVSVYYNEDANSLEYVINNTTSMTSAFYHASPSYDSGGPMSNYYQTYTFSEKLEPNKLRKK